MLTRALVITALAVCLCGFAKAAETDEAAFKERVAACKTEACLINVSHLYFSLWQQAKDLRRVDDTNEKQRLAKEIVRMRAQLHDPDIFVMMEDGRWNIMTEAQKQEWTEKRWGPQ